MKIAHFLAVALVVVVLTSRAVATPLEVFAVQNAAAEPFAIQVNASSFGTIHTTNGQAELKTPSWRSTGEPLTLSQDTRQHSSIALLTEPLQELSDEVSSNLSMDAPTPSVGWILAVTLSSLFVVGRTKKQDR